MLHDIIDRRQAPRRSTRVAARIEPLYPTVEADWSDLSPRRCTVAEAVAWADAQSFKAILVLEEDATMQPLFR